MKKTAALNKLAQAVKNYVQSEQQFNKIAATIQQYQQQGMQKEAQGLMQRLGLSAPPPAAKSNMGRNAALAALLLGGGAAGAHAAGLFGGGENAGGNGMFRGDAALMSGGADDAAPYQTGHTLADSLLGAGSGIGGATDSLRNTIAGLSEPTGRVPSSFQLKNDDSPYIESLIKTIMGGSMAPTSGHGPRA